MTLGEFLKREMGSAEPWNCSTFPIDWCIALGHPDYAAPWRHLTDPEECDAATAGGLLPLWESRLDGVLEPVADLEAGDIAVVAALGKEAGAIWTGTRWALRGERAIHFIDPQGIDLLKAWRP